MELYTPYTALPNFSAPGKINGLQHKLQTIFEQQKTGCFRIRRFVRETGLEPASSYEHMNLNHARLPIPPFPQKSVGRGGFEPPKSVTADLQSAPFGHSGTYPYKIVELAMGLEPATC